MPRSYRSHVYARDESATRHSTCLLLSVAQVMSTTYEQAMSPLAAA